LKPTRSQGSIKLISANVTSYNTAVSSWLATHTEQDAQVFAIQETHQNQSQTRKTQRQMKAWGLEGNFVPAEATGRGGNTGGQFVAAACPLGVSTLAAFSLEGNGWCGVVLEMTGSKMAVFSIYLKTGESILGQTNVQILGALRGASNNWLMDCHGW